MIVIIMIVNIIAIYPISAITSSTPQFPAHIYARSEGIA
jgi:hypothetical protein